MMPTQDDNFILETVAGDVRLVSTGKFTDSVVSTLESGSVNTLELNYAKGFSEPDLSMIGSWPIKRLTVVARNIVDLTPITGLASSLEYLSIDTSTAAEVDLRVFPNLLTLKSPWCHIASTISSQTKLKSLGILRYGHADLAPLHNNVGLEELILKDGPLLTQLDGLARFSTLEHLGLYGAQLDSLDGLDAIKETIRVLHLQRCGVSDLGAIEGLTDLTFLNASDSGDLPTIEPLRHTQRLERLWMWGSTSILDGDLSPLTGLEGLRELRMQSRRHYRPSVEEIKAQLTPHPLPDDR